MDEQERRIIEACDAALSRLVQEFKAHPLLCFSEKDLHWRFCCFLREELSTRKISDIVTNADEEQVSLIHQEYGSRQGRGHRTDVVVLSPNDARSSTGVAMRDSAKRYARPLVAIEFGTEKSEGRGEAGEGGDLREHTKRDFEKLLRTEARETRLVVLYRNDPARKRGGKWERLVSVLEELRAQAPASMKIIDEVADLDSDGQSFAKSGS